MKRLHQIYKRIGLTQKEKETLRANLAVLIRERPVMGDVRIRDTARQSNGIWSNIYTLVKYKPIKTMPAIILILLLGIGGGTSFAAEGAIPGDLLYPVKVSVNEPVRGALSFSTEAKAGTEAKLALRRLEEAEALMASGKIDADAYAELEANFEAFAERVANRSAELAEKSNDHAAVETSAGLEVALRAHEQVLNRLSLSGDSTATSSVNTTAAVSLREKVIEHINKSEKVRMDAEARIVAGLSGEATTAATSATLEASSLSNEAGRRAEEAKILLDLNSMIEARSKGNANSSLNVNVGGETSSSNRDQNSEEDEDADEDAEEDVNVESRSEAEIKLDLNTGFSL